MEAMAATAPAGRLGMPSDISGIAAFLASLDASWINGQVILANDGGTL